VVTVDLGTTERRVVGGGWIVNQYSSNQKGNFGFVAGFATKTKNPTLKGNSVYTLHSVWSGIPGVPNSDGFYNWKAKDSSWTSGGTLSFYQSTTGTKVDSARFTAKCVLQQMNESGVVWSTGNGMIVVDVFDGGQYNPVRKDQYSVKIYNGQNDLWWGSTMSMLPLGGDPLKPGGGNITIFDTK
jgi:hypothetical protein